MEGPTEKLYPLLSKIESAADVRSVPYGELASLAEELREFIVRSVSTNPGHLGASLGVVELTLALLSVYDPERDRIIWDVGHQAYPYKILTGRKDAFFTNRRYRGLCGFPQRAESLCDAFGTGHSSTSVSAALGMATAAKIEGKKLHTVAVIGDGAMTGGMVFEALNNGGVSQSDLLVVLNDNNMSIDPNVGALESYLLDISTSPRYNRMKDSIWHLLSGKGHSSTFARRRAQRMNRAIKTALLEGSNLFEALGFRYFGPIDGHDVEHLRQVLQDLKEMPGPKLLHCLTVKGKGYAPAERNQTKWHAPGLFNYETGERAVEKQGLPPRYQDVFGDTLLALARENPRIAAITPAMPTGSSVLTMMEVFPERAFDVGIAEQHAVTFAAGLAVEGMIPFCAIYSSFMQRAFDQVIHDVALQNLHVIFCLDRAGLVGDDGATHHGVFDLAYMRMVPNMKVCAPMDEYELVGMLRLAARSLGPWAVRYPRGRGEGESAMHEVLGLECYSARRLAEGERAVVLSIGVAGNEAARAVRTLRERGVAVGHYDMRFVKPLDEEAVREAARYERIYTVEDGVLMGGFGSAVLEALADMGYRGQVVRFGIPDGFVHHGDIPTLRCQCGYDAESMARKILDDLSR